MESSCRVRVVSECLVKPASPSPQSTLFLSAIDLMCRPFPYNRRILFYKMADEEEYAAMVRKLKESLARVLADFYPLAGRLCTPIKTRTRGQEEEGGGEEGEGEGESGGRPYVACNDMGAEFVEAEIVSVNEEEEEEEEEGEGNADAHHQDLFEEMAQGGFQITPLFRELTRWASYSMQDHEGTAPLLSIQITRFKNGGIALGVSHSHVLADGYSLWHFMTSWAEYARGECLSLLPTHTRTLMKIQEPSKEKAFWDIEYINNDLHCLLPNDSKVQKVFDFKKEMLQSLKDKVDGKFSSYEVLCAHIWKCTSKARAHAPNTKLGFINAVNMRARMEPPLTASYFGNCLTWGMATATARELEQENLSITTMRIKVALDTCTHSTIFGMLHCLELYGPDIIYKTCLLNSARMRVSSSPKFPTFRVDFGWGKPLATRSVEVEENGKVVLYPGPDGLGSATICIALSQDAMGRLEYDPNFCKVYDFT